MFANLNRQLLHRNSSVQLQLDQMWYIWNHWSTLPGLELSLSISLSLSTSLGWTATRLPLRVVTPSQRSAFAVDSRYTTRSTSSSIVDTTASYSSLEHGLELLAGFPVFFSESVRFISLYPNRYQRVFYTRIILSSHLNS